MASRSPIRLLIGAGLAVAAVVVIAIAASGGGGGHKVSVVVPEASSVVAGQWVRAAGSKVGQVTRLRPVRGGRAARIDLEIDDDAWPLTQGTKMRLRWGGTANYSNRYIDLVRGPAGGPSVVRDGRFPSADFTIPVEFDGFTRTFDGRMRNDLHAFLDDAGTSLGDARTGLRRTLAAGPGAVGQAAFVLEDLDADKSALKTLVDSANRVMGAVRSSQPGLRDLLTGAARTFDAIGSQSTALQQTLQRAPGMFATTRRTLAQADDTLDLASTVTSRIGPGVKGLRSLAHPLNDTLRTVVRVAPDAKSTLRSVAAATPDLNPLLKRVEGLSPEVGSVGAQAVDNLECIRPYTPSIMAFFSNWGDFFSFDDGRDKMIRAQVQNFLPAETNISDYNSAQAKKAWPGLEFGFPRPPGTDAGQPWFLPQCGAGPDALDPAKDPESRPYKSIFQLPKARTSAGVFRNLVGG